MNGAITAAVVGTGAIARQHLLCLASLPGVRTAAVCDISAAAAEAAADRHGVPRWFTDRARMLESVGPDVVHVTTPPASHYEVAIDALDAGAAVIVEKPLTLDPGDSARLLERARASGALLVEDYNYLFQSQVRAIRSMTERGELGEVTHVEADIALDALAGDAPAGHEPDGPRARVSGPARDLVPHLASLAHAFTGPHRSVATVVRDGDGGGPPPELLALVEGERATATLRFSAHSQPDGFWLRVHGTRARASANLFEPRMSIERVLGGPRPLNPLVNQVVEARDAARAAVGGVVRKLGGGPGSYEGLWELLGLTYGSIRDGAPAPVSLAQIAEVNSLVDDICAGGVTR